MDRPPLRRPLMASGVLQMLDEAGAETDVRPALALLAARELVIEPNELGPPLRRAMLLLAAGGDPQRELELDGRAVTALAEELGSPERLDALAAALASLPVEGLPRVAAAVVRLLADRDLAWRAFAAGLLAEELAD